MANLVYSINSHRKIAHMQHCKILNRIPKENLRYFISLQEAHAYGYHLCSCCPPIANRYRSEKKAIDSFCAENSLKAKLIDGTIHIISRHDFWRIIIKGKRKSIFLYHRNKVNRKSGKKEYIDVPGFHCQSFRSESILGYLKYIKEHDDYRDINPRENHIKIKPLSVPKKPVKQKLSDTCEKACESKSGYQKIKGTKKYRKEQKKKKEKARRESIMRVNALIDELAAMNK